MGHKVHPLWQVQHMQPLLALLTALLMGFSIVIFEASFSAVGFGRKSESPLLARMSRVIVGMLIVFLAVRLLVILLQGKFGLLFAGDFASLLFILETVLFIVPLVILMSPARSARGSQLLIAAVSLLMAGTLYRFDAFLFTLNPGPGYSYFPSAPEIMITLGIIAFEIMAFMVLVKVLPVLHREEHA
jgi:Ni/Fe-hydrogenase subunit HybB-like protein